MADDALLLINERMERLMERLMEIAQQVQVLSESNAKLERLIWAALGEELDGEVL